MLCAFAPLVAVPLFISLVLSQSPVVSAQQVSNAPVTWLVTDWGSVYRNFVKVVDKKIKNATQIAGTADHFYIATRDGSVYRDGMKIEGATHNDENVTDLDAWGDDYHLLTLQGRLYRNGKTIMEGRIDRPIALSVVNGKSELLIDAHIVLPAK